MRVHIGDKDGINIIMQMFSNEMGRVDIFTQELMCELQAILGSSGQYRLLGYYPEGELIYEDVMVSGYMPYRLVWRWLLLNGRLNKIEVKPAYEDFYGITMKADHFVNQIDYLKMILEINRHSPYWQVQLQQHH